MTLELQARRPTVRKAGAVAASGAAAVAVLLPWQGSTEGSGTATLSYGYYAYGRQCVTYDGATTCVTASHLAAPLLLVAVLALGAVGIALGAVAAVWLSGPPEPRSRYPLGARVLPGVGAAVATLAAVLYAGYTYADGLGLWTAPSNAGAGWYLEVLAAGLMLATAGAGSRRWAP